MSEALAYKDEFLRFVRFEKRMSSHTITAYSKDLDDLEMYLQSTYDIHLPEEIQLLHLRSWVVYMLNELKLEPKSIQRKISTTNSFFKYLLQQEYISKNPAKNIIIPKAAKVLPEYLEQTQMQALQLDFETEDTLDVCTEKLIVNLLYQTGMRRSELVHLKDADIDFSNKTIKVLGKRNKERVLPLSKSLLEMLIKYRNLKQEFLCFDKDNLLTLESGKTVDVNYVYRIVKRYLAVVTTQQKKSPHILRHTFATHLLNNGAELSAIQKLLGHESLAATQIYTHVNIEKLKEVHRKTHPKSTEE